MQGLACCVLFEWAHQRSIFSSASELRLANLIVNYRCGTIRHALMSTSKVIETEGSAIRDQFPISGLARSLE
jgi:hypothetical protein